MNNSIKSALSNHLFDCYQIIRKVLVRKCQYLYQIYFDTFCEINTSNQQHLLQFLQQILTAFEMGLFYSLMYYISPPQKLSPLKIQISASRMSKSIQLRMQKLQSQNLKLETQLIQMFHKPKRNLIIQKIKINDLVRGFVKFGVYEQLYKCSLRVKNEAINISQDQSKISDQCLKSIFAIVHLYRQFQLHTIIDLKQFIPEPYPTIGVEKLEVTIQQYLKYKETTEYQRNVYILQMIQRHKGQVSLKDVNQVGHGFSYDPQPQMQKQTFSADLYARSIDFQVETELQMQDFAA